LLQISKIRADILDLQASLVQWRRGLSQCFLELGLQRGSLGAIAEKLTAQVTVTKTAPDR
jgi:hypothetical protein